MQPQRDWLTVTELARWLGLSRNTIYKGIKNGDIPFIRIGKRIIINPHHIKSLSNIPRKKSKAQKAQIEAQRVQIEHEITYKFELLRCIYD